MNKWYVAADCMDDSGIQLYDISILVTWAKKEDISEDSKVMHKLIPI